MLKKLAFYAFSIVLELSSIGTVYAGGPPSPPNPGGGGVPTTPKPFMVIQPQPLVTPAVPNALEYDGTDIWLTGTDGVRGSILSGNSPITLNSTVTFGSASVVTLPDGSTWRSTGLIYGSGTNISFPDGSAWGQTGLSLAKSVSLATGQTFTNSGTISGGTVSPTIFNPVTPSYVNLFKNSEFYDRSCCTPETKFQSNGTLFTSYAVSSFSTATNTPVFTVSSTAGLSVGNILNVNSGSPSCGFPGSYVEIKSLTSTTITGYPLLLNTVTPSTSIACSVIPVSPGDINGTDGNAVDYWKKTASMVASLDDYSSNSTSFNKYQIIFKNSALGQQFYYNFNNLDKIAGKPMVIGMFVNHSVNTGGYFRLFINVGGTVIYGSDQTGSGYQWAEMSANIPSGVSFVSAGVEFDGGTNDIFYVSSPMAANGTYLGTGNYVHSISGSFLLNTVQLSPYGGGSFVMPTVAACSTTQTQYGVPLNIYQDSGGGIAPDVEMVQGGMEGTSAAGYALFEALSCTSPTFYGPSIYVQVTNVNQSKSGNFFFNNGIGWLASTQSGSSWSLFTLGYNGIFIP